jgi:hypothetical protein
MTNAFSLEKERRERERERERLKPSNPRKWILPAETPL